MRKKSFQAMCQLQKLNGLDLRFRDARLSKLRRVTFMVMMMVMMVMMVTVMPVSHHAMWQLQLKGLDIRFREVRDASSSKAPGVTQLISFPNKLKLFRLFRPCNIASLQLISKLELKSCSLRLF